MEQRRVRFSNRDIYLLSEMKNDLAIANDVDNPNRDNALEFVWGDVARYFILSFIKEGNRDGVGFNAYFRQQVKEWRSLCWNNPYDVIDGEKVYYLPQTLYASVICHLTKVERDDGQTFFEEFKKMGVELEEDTGEEMFELLEEWGILGTYDVDPTKEFTKAENVMPGLVNLEPNKKELESNNLMQHQH